jgi:hypothetical protein
VFVICPKPLPGLAGTGEDLLPPGGMKTSVKTKKTIQTTMKNTSKRFGILTIGLAAVTLLSGCGGGPYDGTYIFTESDGDSWNVEIRDDTDITGVYVSGASTLSYVGKKMSVSKIDENTYEIKATATSMLNSPTMGQMVTENIPITCRWHKGENGQPDGITYQYSEKVVELKRE